MKKNWTLYKYDMSMKRSYQICLLIAILAFGLQACKKASGDYPGDSFTYDMMYSKAYETYALNPLMKDSMGAILPPAGTVPFVGNAVAGVYDSEMGDMMLPYEYAKTDSDYVRAGLELVNPLAPTADNIAEGKRLYTNMCQVCHGAEGNGQGTIVANGKYKAVPPSYFAEGYIDMPDGKMFHSLTYGKNAMGSYAYALNKKERWQIILYINAMQDAWVAANAPATNIADSVVTQ
jgi:mono/diheme cytochrome c family protein